MLKCLNCGKTAPPQTPKCPGCDMPLEGDWVMDVNKKETAASPEVDHAAASLCWNCRTPLATEGEQTHCPSCGIALKAQAPDGNLKIVPIDRPNNEDSRKIQGN